MKQDEVQSVGTTLLGPTGKPLTEYTTGELDTETLQKAIVQTAFAYHYHNPYVQYDISNCCVYAGTRSGIRRLNCRQSPEQAAYDTEIYTSCTKYVFAVYRNTFGFEMPGYDTWWEQEYDMTPEGEIVVVKYGDIYGSVGETDRAKAVAALNEKIQPGDIIFASPFNDPHGGHTMLYLGDYKGNGKRFIMHSWPVDGGNLKKDTGEDKREPHGAITLQTLEECVLTQEGKPSYCIDRDKIGFFFLFRLFNAERFKKYKLTPSAVSRLEYPFLVANKTADRYIYDDVLPEETITITETIRNRSAEAYRPLTVREYVPEGATLVCAKGATVKGNLLEWTLRLGAAEEQTISYTVQNHKKRGETLVFPAGSIAMIPSRDLSFRVGGKRLTAAQNDALTKVAEGAIPAALTDGTFRDLDGVNVFYREVLGREAGLPKTLSDYLDARFITGVPEGAEDVMNTPRTDAPKALTDMEINHSMTGQYVFMGPDSSVRIFDILPQYYVPGDVFITYPDRSAVREEICDKGVFFVNLGDGKVLKYSKEGASVEAFSETVQRCLISGLFVAVRPTMGPEA